MRTTQNHTDRPGRLLAAVCLVAALAGCTPPEQKALEDGSRLLAAGKTAEALVQLEKAQEFIEENEILKKEPKITGKLYNQLGLAHQIISKDKTGADKPRDLIRAKEYFDRAIDKGGQESKILAYQNRAWLHLEAEEWEKATADFDALIMETDGLSNHVFNLWLEKGTAEFGAERIDDAKESFSRIPNDPLAQNNLGTIAWKQKRNAVAADHFERAIALDKQNTTALRHLGAVRQELKQYPEALEAYRAYHGLVPSDSDIRDLIESLEEYLKPDPIPEPDPEPVAQVEPEPEPKPKEPEPTPEPEPVEVVIVEPPIVEPEPEPEPVAPEPKVVTVAEFAPLPVPEAKPEEAVAQVEVAEPSSPEPEPVATQVELAEPAKDWKQRLNPIKWFGDDDEKTTAERKKTKSQVSWRSTTPVPTTPLPSPRPLASASTNAVKVANVLPSAVAFPRYKYLSPALPNSGDRQVAKTYFDDGDGAQKREEWQRAKAAYLEAAKADPAWFDARFELGQAAYYTGDTDLALQSFEHALAIQPNDGPARFNFAMSLVQGNYYAAAARELETFLQIDPDNAQAHFEAGRLYAQKLNDVARAAVHYKRVIGLKPGHPQAVTIRYWLIRNKTN
ncbi:MAG: tetratricopeptide repeat protein [Verrucomicrobia bacterium]|jgi:tetratricopeptide (TPR) repeat protein|nr:tetratricopeptide repeat protein [Verrucomicrobiota bacterium]